MVEGLAGYALNFGGVALGGVGVDAEVPVFKAGRVQVGGVVELLDSAVNVLYILEVASVHVVQRRLVGVVAFKHSEQFFD